MPVIAKKWEDFDEHFRGWAMHDKESYERSIAELNDMLRKMKESMSREDFDRAVKDMGHEWIDD